MMKKVILFILVSAMTLGLTACGHEHTFNDATCTEPKVCAECGETEGEALGHTVAVGTCANCNEVMNKELMEEIQAYCETINGAEVVLANNMSIATHELAPQVGALLAMGTFWYSSKEYVQLISDNYQLIYDACGEYDELSALKAAAKKVIDSVPTVEEVTDETTYNALMEELLIHIQERENALAVMGTIGWIE